jgi:hypothetical protein
LTARAAFWSGLLFWIVVLFAHGLNLRPEGVIIPCVLSRTTAAWGTFRREDLAREFVFGDRLSKWVPLLHRYRLALVRASSGPCACDCVRRGTAKRNRLGTAHCFRAAPCSACGAGGGVGEGLVEGGAIYIECSSRWGSGYAASSSIRSLCRAASVWYRSHVSSCASMSRSSPFTKSARIARRCSNQTLKSLGHGLIALSV